MRLKPLSWIELQGPWIENPTFQLMDGLSTTVLLPSRFIVLFCVPGRNLKCVGLTLRVHFALTHWLLCSIAQTSFHGSCPCQTRSQDGNGGNWPPNPKVEPKFFRFIKLLVCKPNTYLSANHRNCLRNLSNFNF